MTSDACAVVLGGATAGYSIIHELHHHGVRPIHLVDKLRRIGTLTNKIEAAHVHEPTPEGLRDVLLEIHRRHGGRLVLFPTFDENLEHLEAVYDDLAPFCHLPFNRANLLASLDKIEQYRACERLGVPYPRTTFLTKPEDADGLDDLPFPLLLKPQEKTGALIHPRYLVGRDELVHHREPVREHLARGIHYLASEVVPGDGSNIHAYVALRTADGRILNDWIGKKLSQYPNEFGVFASASNQCPAEVRELGRRLVEGMDLHGISEPEFKYDARDGKFKLMEVNLRSMGWVHVGFLSGVPLHYCQWLHATGQEVPHYEQDQRRDVRLVNLCSEVSNLLYRDAYGPTFRSVLGGGDRKVLALFDWRDPRPSLRTLTQLARLLLDWASERLRGRRGAGPERPQAA